MSKALWIARDEDGGLYLFSDKPLLYKSEGGPGTFFLGYTEGPSEAWKIDDNLYPDVTFENSPLRLTPDFIEHLEEFKPII